MKRDDLTLGMLESGQHHRYPSTHSAAGSAMDSFATLRAYDEAQYFRRGPDPLFDHYNPEMRPYRGSLYYQRVQVLLQGRRRTAFLSMAAGYIYAQLCEGSSALLKQCVPYRYVAGGRHGRIEGQYRRWDMRIKAPVHRDIVEELQQRTWAYEQQRFDALLTSWDTASRQCVFFLESPDGCDETPHIVFSDKDALVGVRPSHLLADCRSLAKTTKELQESLEQEQTALAHFIKVNYAQILEAYQPNVVRMRQRYCIPLDSTGRLP